VSKSGVALITMLWFILAGLLAVYSLTPHELANGEDDVLSRFIQDHWKWHHLIDRVRVPTHLP